MTMVTSMLLANANTGPRRAPKAPKRKGPLSAPEIHSELVIRYCSKLSKDKPTTTKQLAKALDSNPALVVRNLAMLVSERLVKRGLDRRNIKNRIVFTWVLTGRKYDQS